MALAAYVLLEKLTSHGRWLGQIVGAVLLGYGALVALSAAIELHGN